MIRARQVIQSSKLISFLFLILLTGLLAHCTTFSKPSAQQISPPKRIALLLPLHGTLANAGNAIRDGFMTAYYQEVKMQPLKPVIQVYDSSETNNIHSLYREAIADGADIVVGPLAKNNVIALFQHTTMRVPTIALNYLDNNYSSRENFYQFGLSPEDEARQVAEKAKSAGYHHAFIIAPDTPSGRRATTAFKQQWQENGGQVIVELNYAKNDNLNEK
jgi:uncharacterized protein